MEWHDDQYLFRLTSTFGWDDAIDLCDSVVFNIEAAASRRRKGGGSILHGDEDEEEADEAEEFRGISNFFNDSLGQQNLHKKSLQQWLHHAYTQLFYIDQWGNCPLHAACYVKPPVNVIEALFRLGRSIWKHGPQFRGQSPVWESACKDGSTPFLVACSTGASTLVLHAFLNEVEFYIDQNWVDPHEARMLVVRPDDQGTSPLMGWMHFHHSWIERQMMEQGSAGGQSNNHHVIPRQMGERPSSLSLPDYWSLACRMLLFATMNIRPHNPPSSPVLVHRCAAIATHCPVSLLEWVVAYRRDDKGWAPGDVCASTEDSLGRLPLHRALEAADSSSFFDEDTVHEGADIVGRKDIETSTEDVPKKSAEDTLAKALSSTAIEVDDTIWDKMDDLPCNNPKLERTRVKIVKKLLQWHPRAAKTPFFNMRSPLIQTISNGGSWHCNYSDDDDLGLLQVLWGHAPEQLLEVDPVTGLYSFQLAATVSHGRNMGKEREVIHTDTVYNLLRKDPQLISGALIGKGC